ncbi:hypothetical protein HK097_009973, partial [Rhizophlyctis rosea]
MTVLSRLPTARQLKTVQFLFRKPDFLNNEEGWDGLTPAKGMIQAFTAFLNVDKQLEPFWGELARSSLVRQQEILKAQLLRVEEELKELEAPDRQLSVFRKEEIKNEEDSS